MSGAALSYRTGSQLPAPGAEVSYFSMGGCGMFPWLASGFLWAKPGARGLRVSTVTAIMRDPCIPIEHSWPMGKHTCFLVNFPSLFLTQAQEVRGLAGSHRPRVGLWSTPNNDLLRSPTPGAHVSPVGSKSALGIRHNQITGPREVSWMTPASAVPLVGELKICCLYK